MRPFGSVCFFLHGRGFNGDSDRCWLCLRRTTRLPHAPFAVVLLHSLCCAGLEQRRWQPDRAARARGVLFCRPRPTSLARSPFARRGYRCRAARHTGVRACMHGTGRSVASRSPGPGHSKRGHDHDRLYVCLLVLEPGARRPFVRPGEQETVAVLRVCGGTRSTTPGRSTRITDKFCPSLQHPVPVVSTVHCRRTQPHHCRKFSPTSNCTYCYYSLALSPAISCL